MIVATAARTIADRDFVEEFIAAVERLVKCEQVRFTVQFDAKRLANSAATTVATNEITAGNSTNLAVFSASCLRAS
jgi:hypothetical protein